ncbi:unnamed protein product [Effrenium voratum]|uniref:Pentatricopeptide repeat-containing protein, chloroplastic n=1 Tax=Effrenium voratum TaxID=2562239 RepID=A0AA36J4Z7_9DINO|nr:unnamed protein product [Effrenium voratum]
MPGRGGDQRGVAASVESVRRLRSLYWRESLALLSSLQSDFLECGRFQHGAVLSCCSKAAAWRTALEIPREDASAYTSAMQASQRGLRWAACLDLLEEMAARRVPVDLQAQTAALAGSWRRALTSARRHSLEPDSAWSVMVLKALEPRSWHRAFHQLQADAQRGLKKDARQLSAAAGAWPRSLEFLDRPGANIVVYNAVSAGSPWRSALLSLTSALHVALRLDALGYCSAVAAAKAAGRWAWALWLFWDLPKRRLQSDEVLLTAAVQACPDWQVAVLLLDSARRARMRPAVSLSLQVCTSAANASEWRFALRRLARLGPAAHVTAAVRCALQGRAWSWALHLTAGRAARGREGFADVCAMAMTALEKTSRWQRQQKLFEDVRLWRCELDAVCVTVGLSSFRPWQWPSALHLTERCSDDNQDKQRRSVVLEACGADNWRLGVELALRKVEPDLVLFSQASASCEQGQWARALCLRRAASAAGVQADVVLGNIAISASHWRLAIRNLQAEEKSLIGFSSAISACKTGSWLSSLELLREAAWRGLEANAVCVATSILAAAAHHWATALAVMLRYEAQGVRCDVETYAAVLMAPRAAKSLRGWGPGR